MNKAAPKGVDKEKYERCVMQVKQQKKPGTNAFAVCAASMQKNEQPTEEASIQKAGPEKSYPVNVNGKMYDKWEIESSLDTLIRAEEIKKNKDLMKLVSDCAKQKKSALNSVSKGQNVKKSKEEIVKEFVEKVEKGEMTLEDVQKAITSDSLPLAPVQTPQAAAPAAAEPAAPEFDQELFKPFSLGSTLKQGPVGNVLSNVKPARMDYERTYQDSFKNIKVPKK